MKVVYRGRLTDLSRVEDLEDRVLEVAFELGAQGRVWRSACDGRVMRGLTLDAVPGLETMSLLLSAEGVLVPIDAVEAAERAPVLDPPWCSVTTRYGPVEGHVVVVELLAALARAFPFELEVLDETGFARDRDLDALLLAFGAGDARSRVERAAAVVRRRIARPSEHAPVSFDAGETEAVWDAFSVERQRAAERFSRAVDERCCRGEDWPEAIRAELEERGLGGPGPTVDEADLPEAPPFEEPAFLARAREVAGNVLRLGVGAGRPALFGPAARGALELMGGIAQAFNAWQDCWGIQVVQVKRALRGASFARAGLEAAVAAGAIERTVAARHVAELLDLALTLEDELEDLRLRAPGQPSG